MLELLGTLTLFGSVIYACIAALVLIIFLFVAESEENGFIATVVGE